MQRRDLIKTASFSIFGAGLPLSGAQAQNRYAKYAGQSVTINIPAHPHYDAMGKILADFTKETGIKVEVDPSDPIPAACAAESASTRSRARRRTLSTGNGPAASRSARVCPSMKSIT